MKRSMTGSALAGCLTLAVLSAAAVLDLGSSAAQAATSVSPFAGTWSGPWDIAALPDHSGTFDWTISDEGQITGTVSSRGTVVGHVDADGKLIFVGFVDPAQLGGFPFKGTAVIDEDGRLALSATGMFNGAPYNHVEGWLLGLLERK
jgi:hypothetical protein